MITTKIDKKGMHTYLTLDDIQLIHSIFNTFLITTNPDDVDKDVHKLKSQFSNILDYMDRELDCYEQD